MTSDTCEKLESLYIDDFIWYIYIFIVFAALYSNRLEKEYVITHGRKQYTEFHSINLIVLTIAFFIYIYFVFNNFKNYNKKNDEENLVRLIASILFLVGGGILILAELNSTESELDEIVL